MSAKSQSARIFSRLPASAFFAAVLYLCSLAVVPVEADEFQLASGGKIRGQWLNPQRSPGGEYVVETEAGVKLKLAERQVVHVERIASTHEEYKLRQARCGDSAVAHFELAQWCYAHGMIDERTYHLQRVVEREPNHQQARHQLGQVYIDGKWTTTAEERRKEGYIRYKGRWRTIQEIELFEAQEKRELAEKEWTNRLRRWRADLAGGSRSQQAWQCIATIRAPDAVRPISRALGVERVRSVKMLYTDVLANIDSSDSISALVYCSLNDPDIEMFHDCLDKLNKLAPPDLSLPYITTLKDANNARVNRAALALGKLDDRSAISPLIDALTTQHTVVIPGSGKAPADGYSATFSRGTSDSLGSTGGGSSFVHSDEPKTVIVNARNEEVLTALTKLSGGADFGFDATAWRYWLSQERKRESSDTASRRD